MIEWPIRNNPKTGRIWFNILFLLLAHKLISKYEKDLSRLQSLINTCKLRIKTFNSKTDKSIRSTVKKELIMNSKLQTRIKLT